jgi:uncharacterized heparinase superfamily protein
LVDNKLKDFDVLTKSLLRANLTAPQEEAAVARLAALNPHADLKKLKVGSVLVIPDSPSFEPAAGDVSGSASFRSFEASTKAALTACTQRLVSEHKTRAAERDELSSALQIALKSHPEFKARIDAAAAHLAAEAKREAESEAAFGESARAALKELSILGSRHFK